MSQVKIKLKNFNKFEKKLGQAPKNFQENMKRGLFSAAQIVRSDATKRAPSGVSGRAEKLRSNIVAFVQSYTRAIVGVRDTVKHSKAVEFGKKPGDFEPVKALTQKEESLDRWVRLKLGIGGKKGIGVAFAIAKKIEQKGTKAQPYLFPALIENKRKIENFLVQSLQATIRQLT